MTITPQEGRTVVTLATAGNIGARLLKEIAGNDLSTSVDGDSVSSEQFQLMIQQRIINRKKGE